MQQLLENNLAKVDFDSLTFAGYSITWSKKGAKKSKRFLAFNGAVNSSRRRDANFPPMLPTIFVSRRHKSTFLLKLPGELGKSTNANGDIIFHVTSRMNINSVCNFDKSVILQIASFAPRRRFLY